MTKQRGRARRQIWTRSALFRKGSAQVRSKWPRGWSESGQCEPNSWAKLGRRHPNWSKTNNAGPMWANFVSQSAEPGASSTETGANLARCRPNLGIRRPKFTQTSSNFGPPGAMAQADIAQTCAGISEFGRIWMDGSGPTLAEIGRCCSNFGLAEIGPKLARFRMIPPRSVEFTQTHRSRGRSKFGPRRAHIGQSSAQFGPNAADASAQLAPIVERIRAEREAMLRDIGKCWPPLGDELCFWNASLAT